MMHQRNSSSHQGHVMGPCPCGLFHTQTNTNNSSFSMFFSSSMQNQYNPYDHESDQYMYSLSPSSSSSVDCTLSLGTPSTRLTENQEKRSSHPHRHEKKSVSNFCWDLLQPKRTSQTSHTKPSRGTNTNNSNSCSNDSLLARRCANCDTTSTPLWRNGPRGPKSLCNACGIRFKKEERRANAAAAANSSAASRGMMDYSQHMFDYQNNINDNSGYSLQNQKTSSISDTAGNEFRFVDDGDRDSDNGIPFLSWRFNVTDRHSLVHDFTR